MRSLIGPHSSLFLLCYVAAACAPLRVFAKDSPEQIEFFESHVRPILVDHCYQCHSAAKKVKGELRLDTRAGVLKGGKSGAVIVPGEPEKSPLIEAVRYKNPDLQMPP